MASNVSDDYRQREVCIYKQENLTKGHRVTFSFAGFQPGLVFPQAVFFYRKIFNLFSEN